MFSWYKYLIVSLVFSHLGFWSGNLFLIAPFPDLCLLVPFYTALQRYQISSGNIISNSKTSGKRTNSINHRNKQNEMLYQHYVLCSQGVCGAFSMIVKSFLDATYVTKLPGNHFVLFHSLHSKPCIWGLGRNEPPHWKTNNLHMRKNKGTDQRLCFRYTNSIVPLLSETQISSL